MLCVARAAITDGASTLFYSAVQPVSEVDLMEDDPARPGNNDSVVVTIIILCWSLYRLLEL